MAAPWAVGVHDPLKSFVTWVLVCWATTISKSSIKKNQGEPHPNEFYFISQDEIYFISQNDKKCHTILIQPMSSCNTTLHRGCRGSPDLIIFCTFNFEIKPKMWIELSLNAEVRSIKRNTRLYQTHLRGNEQTAQFFSIQLK